MFVGHDKQHHLFLFQGGANRDEAELMGDWFSMVHEKNALVRWEQELMVRAKELELEDRHVRLEHELRHRMAVSGKFMQVGE